MEEYQMTLTHYSSNIIVLSQPNKRREFMTNQIIAILLTVFLSFSITIQASWAQTNNGPLSQEKIDPKFRQFCKTASCRKNVQFTLKKKDGTTFEYSSPLDTPSLYGGIILIYPGETLYIEAEAGRKSPKNLKLVTENKNPDRTIIIKFSQSKDIGDGIGMLLNVINPFSKMLRYNLKMMPLDTEGMYKTSSCPVVARGSVYEMWPHPIFQMSIASLRFINESDSIDCH